MILSLDNRCVSTEAATALLRAAMKKADEISVPMCVAVVDSAGTLKAFARMDGAPYLSVQIAQDKAYTAAGFRMATDAWYDFIKDDHPLALGAPAQIDRLVTFGGGYPLLDKGEVIGAIGVSGGHYTQDMDVAQAGVAVLSGADDTDQ
jgi:uncharacterized protein GlcG (DUF336 family)